VLASVAAVLAATPAAEAATQWNDGEAVRSNLYNPCLGIEEFGALAYAGYQADPQNLPKAGDVFYGHAVFGAATTVGGGGCGGGDQHGELDLVLPPGVSLAIDGAHPINCFYEDQGQPEVANPTCPTHATVGTYGPQLTAGDGGPWDMPPGRLLEVQFPLVSTRQLQGPAGGTCPTSVSDLAIDRQNDCLITAVHVADGDTDPWLVSNEQLFVDPAPLVAAPSTKVTKAKVSSRKRKATFTFKGSDGTGALHFRCKLTGQSKELKRWKACSSPKAYKHLKKSKHVFEVEAIDSTGKAGPAAKKKFRIK
jgi:hypothetical protein